ncbi:MAG: SUMF1/EgtB/PvdO family nonheme iron enzyme, partial [Planctomycetota bacterium]|nr:SUMF1/EgtB/PvdO family nonheme iron enzyme [Planctomycetota bacterium]
EFLTRFRREAQATGKLNHVNIVIAYNVGEEAGTHYYAMEYCEGETLDRILKRDKVLTWDKAVAVVMQVARGLQHAHDHGIIHRDIKPANIFVCKPLGPSRDREGADVPLADARGSEDLFAEGFVAKILDLGLSKNIEGGEQSFYTQTGVALGTPHYISPEQAKGEKGIDGRTDIYSLGATFYHLVTGQTPFQGSTAAIIMMKHLSEELPNPQDINPDIPDGVVQIIQKMMAKDPADRYANCKELLDDLEMVIDGKTPSSQAIDAGKSSVAVARAPRRTAPAPRKTAGPLPPVGARQQQPVAERRRTGHHAADAVPMQQVPAAAPASKRNVYIAAGVLGLGAITFIAALAFSGKQDTGKSDTTKTPPDTRTVTPDTGTAKVEPVVAKAEALPKEMSLDLGCGVKMDFLLVPPGEFMMGGPRKSAAEWQGNEGPIHKVTITKPYYIGKYPVTVAQFAAFVNTTKYQTDCEKGDKRGWSVKDGRWGQRTGVNWRNPGFEQTPDHPVVLVSWDDTQAFVAWASKQTGRDVRLPSEAQWEWAARGPKSLEYPFGEKWDGLKVNHCDVALKNSGWPEGGGSNDNDGYAFTSPVGKFSNASWCGAFDMSGNLWQWVQDWEADYSGVAQVDPQGPANGQRRVVRGGSWGYAPEYCRAAVRGCYRPGNRSTDDGFRCALDLPGGGAPVAVPSQATNQKPETGVTDAWVKMVQAQPAEKQVEEVVKKLKELNPGYDGKEKHRSENGQVTDLEFTTERVTDISPVRALMGLTNFNVGQRGQRSSLKDLSPLKGLQLTMLSLYDCPVEDLGPLKGMPLIMIVANSTLISDLSPLAGMPLKSLFIAKTNVSDLTPLHGMPLSSLWVDHTKVSDLSALRGMPLKSLGCDFVPERDAAILRSIKTLEKINDMPVAEFWKKYPDAGAPKPEAGNVDDPERWKNAINLLPLIDSPKDSVEGTWTWRAVGLVSDARPNARVEIPYRPPDEYDFRVTFVRQEGNDAVGLLVSKAGRAFIWAMGNWENRIFVLSSVNGAPSNTNPTAVTVPKCLENGRAYTAVVEVRNKRVKAYLDGKLITQWETDYHDLTCPVPRRDATLVGLNTFKSPTLFQRVEVLEVTGKGTFTRPDDPAAKEAERKRSAAAAKPDAGALPKELSLDLGGGVKMEFVLVPAGEFDMGNDSIENAKPKHHVKITQPFYMGKSEVTQAQYQQVAGTNPTHIAGAGPTFPVDSVSWEDAQAFCKKLTALVGKTAKLPTEAQWEFACRAGTGTEYNAGQGEGALNEAGWHSGNSQNKTHPVGQKKPNAWGFFDMHGNVAEWCEDGNMPGYYGNSPVADPVAPAANDRNRFARGGSFRTDVLGCRSAARGCHGQRDQNNDIGFRVVVPAQVP